MPLGLFGSSSSKPQILPNQGERRESAEKDGRGTVLRLDKHVVTIEKKLAEGGFAIVYLVSDRKNRQFALKRQFVNDDTQQVEACKRECHILSSLKGHKNIVTYVDHLISKSKSGVYDYMLLTVYYKTSVLRMMNERVGAGKFFSPSEVLSIFCDMCEAVSRLHHSATPVIHRDLKVENILVDERNRGAPPIFVLCDFGSATTRVLSTEMQPYAVVEEEIEKYTTLSYRSPEMVDLYSRKPIGPASDIWAMGVMLFKLCYFSLPFGESAMAIQNGSYSFPTSPDFPAELKAIMKLLLESCLDRRPNIFQTSSLAFAALGKQCPVHNIHKVPVISLSCALRVLEGKPATVSPPPPLHPTQSEPSPLVSTLDAPCLALSTRPSTTSVNPRLRPKPSSSVPRVPLLAGGSPQLVRSMEDGRSTRHSEPDIASASPRCASGTGNYISPGDAWSEAPLSCPLQATNLGFADLAIPMEQTASATDVTEVEKEEAESARGLGHARTASDGGTLSKSAFRPYSEAHPAVEQPQPGRQSAWNPFTAAPVEGEADDEKEDVDWADPFGAAPFDPRPIMEHQKRMEAENRAKEEEEVEEEEESNGKMAEEGESDTDEQRKMSRRRFSYEHIDGVGDDASSDSKGRTDADSTTDELTRGEEEEDADEADSSQTTADGVEGEDVVGSRPLLDDDELEDDDYEDLSGVDVPSCPTATQPGYSTNPFLAPNSLTPTEPFFTAHYQQPTAPSPSFPALSQPHNSDRVIEPSPSVYSRAPATLPRQVTSLSAVPRPPPLPAAAVPPQPLHQLQAQMPPSLPANRNVISISPVPPQHFSCPPPSSSLSSSQTEIGENRPRVSSLHYEKIPNAGGLKAKRWSSESDSPETDDSGAGMCGGGEKKQKEKKKRRPPSAGTEQPLASKAAVAKRHPSSKRGSQGALNASFVNVSFQSEDFDRL